LDLLQWLWIRGGLNAMAEYWKQPGAEEPDVLVHAAERGHADVLKFLIDVVGAPVYKKRELPGNAHVKALWGEWSRRAVSERTTAIHTACAGGHAGALGVLLERGANAKKCDGGGRMPAFLATESGSLSCVKLLYAAKAIPKQRRARSPVVDAAKFGHVDVLRFLIDDVKFDLSATAPDGETALMAAVWR
jgi:ankyrin repeat protein